MIGVGGEGDRARDPGHWRGLKCLLFEVIQRGQAETGSQGSFCTCIPGLQRSPGPLPPPLSSAHHPRVEANQVGAEETLPGQM